MYVVQFQVEFHGWEKCHSRGVGHLGVRFPSSWHHPACCSPCILPRRTDRLEVGKIYNRSSTLCDSLTTCLISRCWKAKGDVEDKNPLLERSITTQMRGEGLEAAITNWGQYNSDNTRMIIVYEWDILVRDKYHNPYIWGMRVFKLPLQTRRKNSITCFNFTL